MSSWCGSGGIGAFSEIDDLFFVDDGGRLLLFGEGQGVAWPDLMASCLTSRITKSHEMTAPRKWTPLPSPLPPLTEDVPYIVFHEDSSGEPDFSFVACEREEEPH